MINKDLANELYRKLYNFIPKKFSNRVVVGLNDHFRFSKYYPGERFKIHKDGVNQDIDGNRSVMTLNIFLNKDFEGGETTFFYWNKRFRCSIKPKPGSGALFDALQYHCGEKVSSGIKYLIRTDVMVKPY